VLLECDISGGCTHFCIPFSCSYVTKSVIAGVHISPGLWSVACIHFIVSIFSISMICIVLLAVSNCFRIQGSKLLSCQVCIHCLNVSSSSSSCQENWKWHFRKGIMLRYVYEMLNVYDGSRRPCKTFQIQITICLWQHTVVHYLLFL
jgi:hypothetical protein